MYEIHIVQNHENGEQIRTHKKKRINKKWLKRYGTYQFQKLEKGQVMIFENKMYVSKATYNKLKEKKNEHNNG